MDRPFLALFVYPVAPEDGTGAPFCLPRAIFIPLNFFLLLFNWDETVFAVV